MLPITHQSTCPFCQILSNLPFPPPFFPPKQIQTPARHQSDIIYLQVITRYQRYQLPIPSSPSPSHIDSIDITTFPSAMGRSLYTPATIATIYKQAGVAPPLVQSSSPSSSSSSSRSSSRSSNAIDQVKFDDQDDQQFQGHQAHPTSYTIAAAAQHQASLVTPSASVTGTSAPKDAPLPWRVVEFDPNDSSLPIVNEVS